MDPFGHGRPGTAWQHGTSQQQVDLLRRGGCHRLVITGGLHSHVPTITDDIGTAVAAGALLSGAAGTIVQDTWSSRR
jgi:hypothetical protein